MRSLKLILGGLIALLSVTPVAAQEGAPFVTPAECPIEVPANADIECGYLSAPENYDQPEGRWIRMPYIILHSPTAEPDATPLLFTEGGPGGDSLQSIWMFAESSLLEDRDIIIFQQRGNFHADPDLTCMVDELFDRDTMSSPCVEKFRAAGIDLTQYHTSVIAEDIESLRAALGIEQWNIFSTSYSTKLAQVLMSRHPEGIRSVILQSVSPLDVNKFEHDPEFSNRVLKVMFTACEQDAGCAASYPNLEAKFFGLVKELNRKPIEVELENNDGSKYPYQVSGDTVIDWMVGHSFYGPANPPYTTAYLPLLINSVSQGDREVLKAWAQWETENQFLTEDFFSLGLYLVVTCQDEYDPALEDFYTSQEAQYPQLDGYLRFWEEWQLCQVWDLPKAESLAVEPLSSQVPTLVLAGSFDPVTPPEGSLRVAEKLENAYYVEFPSKGHSIDEDTSCGLDIKRSFLFDPWSEPDTSCLENEPPPTFVLSEDLIPLEGIVLSVEDINFGVPQGKPGFEAMALTSLGVFLIEVLMFLGLSVLLLVKRTERKNNFRRFGYQMHLLATLVAVLTISSVILISALNPAYVWNQPLLNSLGYFQVSGMSTALGVTVLLQMVFCVVLLIGVVWMWTRAETGNLTRFFLPLVVMAGFSFWVFYFRWDLLNLLFL